jgi:hypothetical protein
VVLMGSSIFGMLIAGVIFANNAEYYDCVTPDEIIIQSGYFDYQRHFAWDDLESVRAWCWTAKPRGGRSYQGATLTLASRNGEQIPFGLVNGGEVLTREYQMLRAVLKNRSYGYYVNSTVTPSSCPPSLYPLLWYWRNE